MKLLACYFLLFFGGSVIAQPFKMVKDINTSKNESELINYPTELNGYLIYVLNLPGYGKELWKYDLLTGKTSIVKDIYPGDQGSDPLNFIKYNGFIFFRANDGISGEELWKTNGTTYGTFLVKDIAHGAAPSSPSNFIVYNNLLFFSANGGLWKTDGTEQGTVPVVGNNVITRPLSPEDFTIMKDVLYFEASTSINGAELWRTDGTEAGTYMVRDIYPGPSSGNPSRLIAYNDLLFFRAINEQDDVELWRSDGTTSGTVLLKDISPGLRSSWPLDHSLIFNNRLFFTATGSMSDAELWTSDGSPEGTIVVKKFYTEASPSTIVTMCALKDTIYMAVTIFNKKPELWKTDGTANGTQQWFIDNMNPYIPSIILTDQKHLYFLNPNANKCNKVWVSDGTYESTQILNESTGCLRSEIWLTNGHIYFQTENLIWTTDGTKNGTKTIITLESGTKSSYPQNLSAYKGFVFFCASDSSHGPELWKSDGTETGTVLLKDLIPGLEGGYPEYLSKCNDLLLFYSNGYLWRTDGSESGTSQLNPSIVMSHEKPAVLNNSLYFVGTDNNTPSIKNVLWKTDGTAEKTVPVNSFSMTEYKYPQNLTAVGNTLFFNAYNESSGYALWKIDTMSMSVVMVKDIWPGAGYEGTPTSLTAASNYLYFVATDPVHGYELWKTDGSENGTTVIDINPGPRGSNPYNLFAIGNELYFTADDSVHGNELWKTNGTIEGTMMIKDIIPGSERTYCNHFINANGTLFFDANDPLHGFELWKTNGTEEGTLLVKDVWEGAKGQENLFYDLLNCSVRDSLLLLTRNDGIHGEELWMSNGFESGTFMIQDLVPGPGNSSPNNYTIAGDKIYFVASTPATGAELWTGNIDDIFPKFKMVFNGVLNKNDVLLNWKTDNESELAIFEVQRNTDSRLFNTIGQVQAKGGIGQHANYDFTDENVHRLNKSVLYYRMAMRNKAGELSYSDTLQFILHDKVQCGPNPAHKELNIIFTLVESGNISFIIYTQQGMPVLKEQLYLEHGVFNKTINVEYLPTGIYYLKIKGEAFSGLIKFLKL